MDLKSFWTSMSVPERAAFAVRCGTTFKHLQNVVYGRTCAPELAIAIEQESGGKVLCDLIRPDCSHLYGYLRGPGSDRVLAECAAASGEQRA
ncbi:YdaS family helix-turn-helix protein [Methyloversatilis discipulorum]|uniref:YdaS family helix-turn-helix protein n=1 Tax=Methyloversatilis discipulorum TaxID=1119528 RepID=UPI001A4BCFC2|nr:YdaS family helix-turn-helix protein [Methyloversatilis discipulorum]MBL8469662.1 helix-turn-helix domain-containing protein [Methyloversatilis discipulorum]